MQKRNILIIDDEPKMCKILRFALEPDGYTVTTAESAEDGLEKFSQEEFDLVVTDLKMPGKDGLHVLGKVKKQKPNTEVILMTAYATAQNAVEAMKKGAYDYITKPVDHGELISKVELTLERRAMVLDPKFSFREAWNWSLAVITKEPPDISQEPILTPSV
ncbi:sigma-54-dependent Fis family transcriptional regulator [candidate division KSB1 bacterium]|nr:sigma-54-dependent Fis family transcriptional regulator [candidate division KSB1 bacterium]